MDVQQLTLDLEEYVSNSWLLPYGRQVTAELEFLPTAPPPPDTLQLVVEVRRVEGAPFEEWAVSHELTEAGRVSLQVPTNEGPEPKKPMYPGAFRLRIVHRGRLQPRYGLRVHGL